METGLLVAYIALGVMAVIPIYFGSFAALKITKKEEKPEDQEFFSLEDAKMFPIFGSATLFGLYLLFTYFDKKYINYVLTVYFSLLGLMAFVKSGLAITRGLTGWEIKGDYKIEMFKKEKEILSYHFGHFHLLLTCFSVLIAAVYALTKNWMISNFYGEAFATSAIQLLNLDSFKTGMILLSGLFFYDIFWVFGTDVMVTVAKSFDAPIKVIWPKDILELLTNGKLLHGSGAHFTMLGLGDIVIPGIYVAMCLQFDYYQHVKKAGKNKSSFAQDFPKPYFIACFVAYVAALITTFVVMHTFQAAQPALLYLSPACILSTLFTAVVRGELKEVFAFEANPSTEEPATEKTKENKTTTTATPKKKKSVDASAQSDVEEETVHTPRRSAAAAAGKRRSKKAE